MKKYIITFLFLACLLINFSVKATRCDNIFYFDNNTNVSPSEILNVPSAETPSPEVTVYFPRVDFSSGKNRPFIFESSGQAKNYFQRNFFNYLFSSCGIETKLPVYLLNNVFRI